MALCPAPTTRRAPTVRVSTPFAGGWEAVAVRLTNEPRLAAKTPFDRVKAEHPGSVAGTHRRTFGRRVRQWKATHGTAQDVKFQQVHRAGDLATSDFTSMNARAVTIRGQPFDHLVYHFVLSYSNWEPITLCASEPFEALADGIPNALWELGGTPPRQRSDRLSAPVNNLSAERAFRTRYQQPLAHYGRAALRPGRTADQRASAPRERRQRVGPRPRQDRTRSGPLMRGGRDFVSRAEYVAFLRTRVATRNAGRGERFGEELVALRPLPASRIDRCLRLRCRVDSGRPIHIRRNTYSAHGRPIGQTVGARRYADRVELWHADRLVDTLPRLAGRDKHAVQYRHVIDSLAREPGAFAHYRYRGDLFPTSRFRLVRCGRSVYFATCSLLVPDLLAPERDLRLERLIKKLSGFEALIIDDLGYVQQSREEMEGLFTRLAQRYERGSVLSTSNLPFSQWTAIFKDPMTTAAAIDRPVRHSAIVELNVPSYRLETAPAAKKGAAEPTTATEKK